MKALIRAILLSLLSITYLGLNLTPANAHAEIIEEYPQENISIAKLERDVNLKFSEDIKSTSDQIKLFENSKGERDIDVEIGKRYIKILGSSSLPKGSYSLSWGAISIDGHYVNGVLQFNIGEPALNNQAKYNPPLVEFKFATIIQVLGLVFLLLTLSLQLLGKERWILNSLIISITIFTTIIYSKYQKLQSLAFISGEFRYHVLVLSSLIVFLLLKLTNLKIGKIKYEKIIYLSFLLVLSSEGLFVGHAKSLERFSYLAVILLSIHLYGAFNWMAWVTTLIFDRSKFNLKRVSKRATQSIAIMIPAGIMLTLLIYENSKDELNRRWVSLLLLKIMFILLALVLGLYHHKKIQREKDISLKSIFIENIIFIPIFFTTSLLLSNSPSDYSKKNNDINSYTVNFDDGTTGKLKISSIGNSESVFMLDYKGREISNGTERSAEIILSNKAENIYNLELKLLGKSKHFMGEKAMPVKGSWRADIKVDVDEFTTREGEVNVNIK